MAEARAQPAPDGDVVPDVENQVDVTPEVEIDPGDVEVDTDVAADPDAIDEEEPTDVSEAPAAGGLVADDEDADEDPTVREDRRRVAHQTAIEQTEPRPPEVDVPVPDEPEWTRHIEVGADAAFVLRPFHNGVVESPIRYESAIAWGLHAHFNALPWLRLTPYFLDVHHGLDIPQGALVTSGQSIDPSWTLSDATVTTYVFGLKVQPTLNFTPRLRAWLTAGIGWGRFGFPEMTVMTDPEDPDSSDNFVIRQRKSTFVEFPLGLGISFDIIDRWLALEFESLAAPMTGQSGNAHERFQAIGPEGTVRNVGRFGAAEVSFVQALSFSLIL
ncbi:MAG: hypothetical protein RIF41_06535 [Polyangiaceae bacterium]